MEHTQNRKILFYEASSGFGGSTSALVYLIGHLDRETFSPVTVFKNYGSQFEKIKETKLIKLRDHKEPENCSNLRYVFYFVNNILPEALKLYSIIKKERVSLVHVNINVTEGIAAIIASKLSGVPCVCHIRETRKFLKRERFFARWVDKFIILNKRAYELYKTDVPEEKIKVIYDGIDLDYFQGPGNGAFRLEFGLGSAPAVGVIGRIVKGKGQKEFVLAAKSVLEKRPDVKFIIVGDAPTDAAAYYGEVKELVKQENLAASVIFTGYRKDITNVIRDLDVVVLPSTTYPEGLPNAIIEAMALRKPVVATDIPGPSDIVADKETGFLVPAADTKSMSEKILRLLDDQALAARMGEKGRLRAEELFDIKKQVKMIEDLYKDVLSAGRA